MGRFGALIGLISWRMDGGLSPPTHPAGARSRLRRGGRRRCAPGLERLEDRIALSTITVNTFTDETNGGDGVTSLREAIAQVASNPGDDTIILPSGTYLLDVFDLGPLSISDASGKVTIQSSGGTAKLDAQLGDKSVFDITPESHVDLVGLTITGGVSGCPVSPAVCDPRIRGDGAGITNRGTLTISDSTISDNLGGGILNEGNLTIDSSTVSGNGTSATTRDIPKAQGANGGGITNSGTLTIVNSTIRNNSTGASGPAGASASGGGIANNSGTLTIVNSTISGNTASATSVFISSASGGGIANNSGTLTIVNSTISGNTASATNSVSSSGRGGGVANSGTLTIVNSTISGNSVSAMSGLGGGLRAYASQ